MFLEISESLLQMGAEGVSKLLMDHSVQLLVSQPINLHHSFSRVP